MFSNYSPAARRAHRFLSLSLVVLAVACGGGEGLLPALTGGGPSGSELVFSVPQDGAQINTSQTLSVTGPGVTSVAFQIDGSTAHDDSAAPFEWTLSPESYAVGEHLLNVIATTGTGEESVSVSFTITEAPTAPPPTTGGDQPTDVFEAVKNLQGGQWLQIPNTPLTDVQPDPLPGGYFAGVTIAWSSGAFDTKRNRLIIFGGGHTDYAGNELYAFELDTLKWKRLTEPSKFADGDPNNSTDQVKHPDGRPVSRHTYEYIEYIPSPVDRFFCGGGAGLWRTGQFGDDITWLFDFDAGEWSQHPDTPEAGIGSVAAVDANGTVWQHKNGLASYDPATDKWTRHTQDDGVYSYLCTAEVDTTKNRLIIVGYGKTYAYDLSADTISAQVLSTTGDKTMEDNHAIGLAYHPSSNRMVAWDGGSAVYTLDMETLVWKKIDPAAGSGTPAPAHDQGTYGRFRYSPKNDLFIVYSRVTDNVCVYRLPAK